MSRGTAIARQYWVAPFLADRIGASICLKVGSDKIKRDPQRGFEL